MPGIDMFRVVAFVAVVLIHAAAYADDDPLSPGQFIVALCRFAVPYFLIASGYFLGDRGFRITATKIGKRLIPIFLFWALFYCWFFDGIDTLKTPGGMVRFLYTGLPGYHLWFLPALGSAVVIFAAARDRMGWKALFALAALFYLVGMAFGPWHTLLGLPGFGGRNGPFFALIFVALGGWWKARGPTGGHPLLGASFVAVAIAALFVENWLLLRAGVTANIAGPDFSLMTIPYGAAMFFLALSCRDGRVSQWLAAAGPATLGMYLIHILILVPVQGLIAPVSLGARLSDAAIVAVASAISVLVLMRIPGIKRIVT